MSGTVARPCENLQAPRRSSCSPQQKWKPPLTTQHPTPVVCSHEKPRRAWQDPPNTRDSSQPFLSGASHRWWPAGPSSSASAAPPARGRVLTRAASPIASTALVLAAAVPAHRPEPSCCPLSKPLPTQGCSSRPAFHIRVGSARLHFRPRLRACHPPRRTRPGSLLRVVHPASTRAPPACSPPRPAAGRTDGNGLPRRLFLHLPHFRIKVTTSLFTKKDHRIKQLEKTQKRPRQHENQPQPRGTGVPSKQGSVNTTQNGLHQCGDCGIPR